ncbi:unnamed protein product [Sphagnum tenellum]
MENMLRILEDAERPQDPAIWIRAEAAIQHELFGLQVEAPMATVLEDVGASASTHTTPDANCRSESNGLGSQSNGMEQWLTDVKQDPLPCLEQDTLPLFELVEGDEVCY